MKYLAGACYGIAFCSLAYGIWTHFVDSPVSYLLYFAVPAVVFTLVAENV